MKKFALISVYDKSKLSYLCGNLKKCGYNIVSTGGTALKIRSLGFKCIDISSITNMKEILDGRVKTINSSVFGSILYNRNEKRHVDEFQKLKIPSFDLVIVNLYPFEKYAKHNLDKKIIEMIDIGGPSLLRASSKNYEFITSIPSTSFYKDLIKNMKNNNNLTTLEFRKKMAAKTFKITSKYDSLIYNWLIQNKEDKNKKALRYGENPGQKAFISKKSLNNIFDCQINGKELSYNNIVDVDSGLSCLREFSEPTCVIIKHSNPCGVASSPKISKAFLNAYRSDPKSAFGGIITLNRTINSKLAKEINKNFFEIVVGPKFDNEALKILTKKKNLILLQIKDLKINKLSEKSTSFGVLTQTKDLEKIDKNFIKLVSLKKANNKTLDDIIFALKVVKHLNSNAIVLAKNMRTIGIGLGQTNRIDSLRLAIDHNKSNNLYKKFVCASDGFFPFTDAVKLLKKNGCKDIVQPFGSKNDGKIINYAVKHKLTLYYAKKRLFKH